jgi:anti-anti-sigma factor
MVAQPERAQTDYGAVAGVRVVDATDTMTALAVEGECDLTTAPELADIARRFIAEGRNVIVDLSEVEFLDASTVRALLEVDAAARARGCTLVVQLGGSGFVGRVLGITGADRKLATAGSRRAAVELLAVA